MQPVPGITWTMIYFLRTLMVVVSAASFAIPASLIWLVVCSWNRFLK